MSVAEWGLSLVVEVCAETDWRVADPPAFAASLADSVARFGLDNTRWHADVTIGGPLCSITVILRPVDDESGQTEQVDVMTADARLALHLARTFLVEFSDVRLF